MFYNRAVDIFRDFTRFHEISSKMAALIELPCYHPPQSTSPPRPSPKPSPPSHVTIQQKQITPTRSPLRREQARESSRHIDKLRQFIKIWDRRCAFDRRAKTEWETETTRVPQTFALSSEGDETQNLTSKKKKKKKSQRQSSARLPPPS